MLYCLRKSNVLLLTLVRRSESVYWTNVCGSDSTMYHTHCNTAWNINTSDLLLEKSCRLLSAVLFNQCLSRSRFSPFFAEQHDTPSFSSSLPPSLTTSLPHLSKIIVSDFISPLSKSTQCILLGLLKCGYFEFPRTVTYADVPWSFEKKVLSLYCMNKISHVSKQRGMCLSKYLSMPAGIWSVWRSAGFVHALVGLYVHVIKSWIYLGLSLTHSA